MFIKVTNLQSKEKIIINTQHILTIEPYKNNYGVIVLSDYPAVKTTESFDQIVTMLRTQGLFVV